MENYSWLTGNHQHSGNPEILFIKEKSIKVKLSQQW